MRFLIFILFVFLLSATLVRAAGLQLTSIGTLNISGKTNTEYWYAKVNPKLTGQADPSSIVSIIIDTSSYSASASATGAWSYTPTTLTTGDHDVSLTSGVDSLSFTLHIGSAAPTATPSSSPKTLPVTGALSNTLLLLGLGAGLVILGVKFSSNT
jgi:hypothetical protein